MLTGEGTWYEKWNLHLKTDRLYGQLSGWDFSNHGNTPFFFFFQGGTIRVVAGLPTASLSLYHIGRGIETGRTSAQHGNWKINGYKLHRVGFGKEVSVVPLKLPYSSGCVRLRVYSMRKLTFRYIHVKHKRAEDYRLLPCKLKFSNHMCWAKIKIWMRSATLVKPQ